MSDPRFYIDAEVMDHSHADADRFRKWLRNNYLEPETVWSIELTDEIGTAIAVTYRKPMQFADGWPVTDTTEVRLATPPPAWPHRALTRS